jgi:hypothetical protein
MGGDVQAAPQRRMAAYRRTGSPRFIDDRQVLAEVAELRSSLKWPALTEMPDRVEVGNSVEAIVLLGSLLWARQEEPAVDSAFEESLEVVELFAAAYPFAPGSVPAPLRAVCAALAVSPPVIDHVELNDEAMDLLSVAAGQREPAAVDRAVERLHLAVLAARGHPNQPYYLSHLATAWTDRFTWTGAGADIDRAVAANRRALTAPVRGRTDRAGHLANLSAALLTRFEHTDQSDDLDEALTVARHAVETAAAPGGPAPFSGWRRPPDDQSLGDPRHAAAMSWDTLAAVLSRSFHHYGDLGVLDEAVTACRYAVRATSHEDPEHPERLANLASVLLARFEHSLTVADLEGATAIADASLDAAPDGHPCRARALVCLANAYIDKFEYTSEIAALDRAIGYGRDALAASDERDTVGRGICLSNLGAALHARFDRIDDLDVLNEAVAAHRAAVDCTPPTGVHWPNYLNNLGTALRARYEVTDDVADLTESSTVLRQAVGRLPQGSVSRADFMANLASSLTLVFKRTGETAALDEATALLREVEGLAHGTDSHRSGYLALQGDAWRAAYDLRGDLVALDAAIAAYRRAVDATSPGQPSRTSHLVALGGALRRRFARTGDPATGREAVLACRSAAESTTAPATSRALAARNWAQTAAELGDIAQADAGFAATVGLLDMVARRGLHRADQERLLTRFAAAASNAAAWALRNGRPQRAVELLEQGRGVLLAHVLEARSGYNQLHADLPELARELAHVHDALEKLPSPRDRIRPDTARLASRRNELANRREELIARIRQQRGYGDFLRPPTIESLHAAAAGGPVVIINISGYGCDALTVTEDRVHVTPLPTLSAAEVTRRAAGFFDALRGTSVPDRDLSPVAGDADRTSAGRTVADTMAWLWNTIARPILTDLAIHRPADPAGHLPRVWWSPTGPLTFLPIHAAAPPYDPETGEPDGVLTRAVSSYAPTIRLLAHAGRPSTREDAPATHLIAALPVTPGHPDLPAAAVEAADLAARFPRAEILTGPAATADATLDALRRCPSFVHFACHGTQDLTDPSAGSLRLYDRPVSVRDIAGTRTGRGEIAFLSACHTFRGGAALADEAITVATAFQLAGFRHIIGTLWTIADSLAPAVAEHIYQNLTGTGPTAPDPGATSRALHAAVSGLRHRYPTSPWIWAPYVHLGP